MPNYIQMKSCCTLASLCFIFGDRHIPVPCEGRDVNLAELMATMENGVKKKNFLKKSEQGKELRKNKRGEGGEDSKERYI